MKRRLVITFLGLCLAVLFLRAITGWTTKRLTYNSGSSEYPEMAVDSSDHLHVVWDDNTPGNHEIFYKKSTDGGTTWATRGLTRNSGVSINPDIASDSNDHIHVVWVDGTPGNYEIFYKKSTDGGINWTTKRLTYNSVTSVYPCIAVDSNDHIHVVWVDNNPGNYEIFSKKSTDGGINWTTKRLTYNSGDSSAPAITADSNNHLHVVWVDNTPGNYEIFYKKSTDGGTNWTTKRLTYNSGDSSPPAITADSNNHLHVVWHNFIPGKNEIFYKKSTDGGSNWTTKRLTYNSGGSYNPVIATDSNNYLHVVWNDSTPGRSEIYYKKSTDGGSNWTTERLTYNSTDSYNPVIATDSMNHLHVVWYDNNPGNWEIYYKRR